MAGEHRAARRSIWRRRGRRMAAGLNAAVAVALAGLLAALANYLVHTRLDRHWDISRRGYYRLSDKTRALIAGLAADVHVTAVFRASRAADPTARDVRALLREYDAEAARAPARRLHIELVDPDRDLARARALQRDGDVSDAGTVVFECEGRAKHVSAEDLYDYAVNLAGGNLRRRPAAFRGEETFSSAIQSVVQSTRPSVYFLTGHGERQTDDHRTDWGYFGIARALQRDNIRVASLQLADPLGVPRDCAALVIAGPERKLADAETTAVARYLEGGGRLLALLDPAGATGLEKLLQDWGVALAGDVVVGGLTATGKELMVTRYGSHPITRRLQNVVTMFYMPRSVEPAAPGPAAPESADDKARVTVLVTSPQSYAEMNMAEQPPKFDAGVDRPGPISLAVAVEKGRGDVDLAIRATRIVVVGDSDFVSNGALRTGAGGNVDLFLSAVNWLVEREALLAVGPPRIPGELRLDTTAGELRATFASVALGIPLLVAAAGTLVWIRRRH
jgi:hypothetical protein